MKRLFLSFTAILAISGILFMASCDEEVTKIDTKPAESALSVMVPFYDIVLLVDNGLKDDSSKAGMRIMGRDYTQTIIGDYPEKTIIWDFGTEGDYQGIIKLVLTNDYDMPSAIVDISFEDLIFDGKHVYGEIIMENLGQNDQEMVEYTMILRKAKIGNNILDATWKFQHTFDGSDTEDYDVFTISQLGEQPAYGKSEDGDEFTLTITKGLVLDLSCEHYITSGIFELLSSNGDLLVADFGDGECDNRVNVSNGFIRADIFF